MLLAPEVYSVWDAAGTRRGREGQRPCRASAEERVDRGGCLADARARSRGELSARARRVRSTRSRSDEHEKR